ncbi:hypothetical protein DL765_000460 [Monosporascus sp. GIB2]|nr:hypothetical protein DL765_000460 [Monosporascus sp. GIB2]
MVPQRSYDLGVLVLSWEARKGYSDELMYGEEHAATINLEGQANSLGGNPASRHRVGMAIQQQQREDTADQHDRDHMLIVPAGSGA